MYASLGLSPFLRQRLVERLRQEEQKLADLTMNNPQ